MKITKKAMTAAAVFLLSAAFGFAQNAPPSSQGFSVPNLLFELSLFLPQKEANFYRPPGQSGLSPQGGGQHGSGPQGGGRGSVMVVERDPKLFLTAAQIDILVPLLQALYKQPFPSPSQAKKLQATVDGILTAAQKAARDRFRQQREKAIAQRPPQAPSQGGPAAPQLTPLQRNQRLIENFITLLGQRQKQLAR